MCQIIEKVYPIFLTMSGDSICFNEQIFTNVILNCNESFKDYTKLKYHIAKEHMFQNKFQP